MPRLNNTNKRAVFRLVLMFNFLFLGLSACVFPTSESIETYTPSPSATPTCSPNIQLSTPDGWETTSRLFVVLYDPRSSTMGDQYLELANGEETQDTSLFIEQVLPSIIGPGDHVAVFQLGLDNYDDARVTSFDSYITIPQLYDPPVLQNTVTPLPTTTQTPKPGFKAVQATNTKAVYLTSIASTKAADNAKFDCEKIIWNESAILTATAWQGTQAAEVSTLSDQIQEDMGSYNLDESIKTFSTDELFFGGLYYGLSFANSILESECIKHDECILIIIDDLSDPGKYKPDGLSINLNGIEVFTIMMDCEDLNSPSCKERIEYWNDEFTLYGASKEDIIYWNGVHVELNLIDTIGR